MSGGGDALFASNEYAKLAEGGIYCDREYIEQPESYILAPDGTTASASPFPRQVADCSTDMGNFSIVLWPSHDAMTEEFTGSDPEDTSGFVSYGDNWMAYWGGLEDLSRQEADTVSTAIQGTTATWGELCTAVVG